MRAYPGVRRDDTVDVLHGEAIADPYRWLEDGDSAETRAFIEAERVRRTGARGASGARSVP